MAQIGRSLPIRPHVAKPVIATGVPQPPARIIHGAITTGRGDPGLRRQPPIKPHLAAPVIPNHGPIARTLVVSQARPRALVGRGVSSYTVRWASSPPAVPRGTIISQAQRRPYVGRTGPKAHLAAPVLTSQAPPTPIDTRSLVVSQALARDRPFRRTQRPLVAQPLVGQPPALEALVVSITVYRAPALPARYRNAPRPHLAQAIHTSLAPPLARGAIVTQALRRQLVGRQTVRPHIARPVVTPVTKPPRICEPTSVHVPAYAASATVPAHVTAVSTPSYAAAATAQTYASTAAPPVYQSNVDTPDYDSTAGAPAYAAAVTTPDCSGGV